jgi:ubiquinone/menaquinone biosynthesis C-methylase UbiE
MTPPATTKDWRAVAKVDPLWAVASWPNRRGRWERDAFYKTGEDDWGAFVQRWRRFDPDVGNGVCIDVGCGVGRVSAPMAATFDSVIAVDVSSEMIGLAREVCPPNVAFLEVEGPSIPLKDASVDAAFSVHVLQHLSADDARASLIEIARVLRPGGSAMIHVPFLAPRRSTSRQLVSRLKLAAARWRLRRGADIVAFKTSHHDPLTMLQVVQDVFAHVELQVFPAASNGVMHEFWFLRR